MTSAKVIPISNSLTCSDFQFPNATCIDYFCDGNPQKVYNSTIRNKLNQRSYGKYHIAFLHHCYYCNHGQRGEFFEKLNAGKCEYYWRPPADWYCNDNSPALVSTFAFENYNKLNYNDDRSISNNIPAMLNTTRNRVRNKHENGTIERAISNSYYCYCKSTNRYGMVCDDYTNYWIPIRYNALPFISLFIRILVLIAIFVLIFEPRAEQSWRDTMGKHRSWSSFLNFLREFFEKLSYHVIFFMVLGIICLMIEELAPLSSPTSALRRMNGNFRIIGWFIIFASYTVLLIIWANIYERSSTMLVRATVAIKFKYVYNYG